MEDLQSPLPVDVAESVRGIIVREASSANEYFALRSGLILLSTVLIEEQVSV